MIVLPVGAGVAAGVAPTLEALAAVDDVAAFGSVDDVAFAGAIALPIMPVLPIAAMIYP